MPVMGFNTKDLIAMWSGLLSAIPDGFGLCDGAGGRPNLLATFVKGVPDAATNPGSSGGSATHSHAASGSHNHSVASHSHGETSGPTATGASFASGATARNSLTHTHTSASASATASTESVGSNDAENLEPPYYALAFIQCLRSGR